MCLPVCSWDWLCIEALYENLGGFFMSGRSIPAWVTGLAFLSANLGALELVGMAASGAKYGIATAHFYWLGAIPAMVFLAVFMMPFYYGSKARSVPEYLKLRFDERIRCFNSLSFAVMPVFASGISMNALAKLLNQATCWNSLLAHLRQTTGRPLPFGPENVVGQQKGGLLAGSPGFVRGLQQRLRLRLTSGPGGSVLAS